MELSEKLKNKRKELGISQEEVAEKMFVSRQTISNWETGRTLPDIKNIILISEIYQISLDELIKGDKEVMEKIEKDNDVVVSNKKVVFILLGIAVAYLVLYLLSQMIEIPKITSPFVNGIFILVLLGIGLTYLIKKKDRFDVIPKIDKGIVIKIISLCAIAVVLFSISSLINQLITLRWQENTIKVLTTILVGIIGSLIFKK